MDRRTRAPGCGSNSIIYESRRLRNTQPPVSRSGPRAHGRIRPVCRREAALASGRRLCYHGCGRFFRSQDETGRGVHAELYCRGARGIPGVRVPLSGGADSSGKGLGLSRPDARHQPDRLLSHRRRHGAGPEAGRPRPQAGALPEGRGVRGLHHLLLFCPGDRRSSEERAHSGGPALCGGKPGPRRCGGICRGSGGPLTPLWRAVEKSLCFFENFTCIFKTFLL